MTALVSRLALIAIPFASFLVASPRLTLDQFEAPKHLGIALMAGLLMISGAWLHWRRHPAVIGWLSAVILAAALSPHPVAGWLGGEEYQEGALTCAIYAILFLAGAATNVSLRARFQSAILLAAGLAALYALCQRAGLDPFPGERFRHVRAFAGNPDFLAQQMALAVPFALAIALRAGATFVTAAAFASVAVFVTVAGLTGSRAGTAAAVIGLILTTWPLRASAIARPRILVTGALLVVALIAAERLVPPELSLGTRLRALASEGGFRIARGDIWRGTARAISEQPVTGWGPDTLGSVFMRTAPIGWADQAGLGVTARRAHDDPLHWLAAAGVIGLGGWLWVLVGAFRNPRTGRLESSVSASLVAVLAHNLVSFGTAGTLPVFWVLLGMRSRPAEAPDRLPVGFTPILIPAFIVIAAIPAVRLTAGGYGYVGHEAERAGTLATAAPAFAAAARMTPLDAAAAVRAGRSAELTGAPREALSWFERAVSLAPRDGLILGHVGRIRGSLARAAGDRAEQDAAHALLLRSVELAPSQPSLWGAAIMSAQALGRTDEIARLVAGMQRASPIWASRLLNSTPPSR